MVFTISKFSQCSLQAIAMHRLVNWHEHDHTHTQTADLHIKCLPPGAKTVATKGWVDQLTERPKELLVALILTFSSQH